MRLTRWMASFTMLAVLAPSVVLAVDGNKAAYIGGTVRTVKEKAEGVLDTSHPDMLTFNAKKDGQFAVPYTAITSLEYGQKAGRRVAVAVMVSPLALFSKKRNHYLTVGYKDAQGADQAAVLELGKDIVRTALKVIEVRSGKAIEYQDEDARKSGIGGGK